MQPRIEREREKNENFYKIKNKNNIRKTTLFDKQ